MKLLLKKDVEHLGFVGDFVDVKDGYARNYLLPQDLAVAPTPGNIKGVEAAKSQAAEERRLVAEARQQAAERLAGAEVTIKAAANEEGVLYGSVGAKEIAAALRMEGHTVDAEQVHIPDPIRELDNLLVPVHFTQDTVVEVKVWVVRETAGIDKSEDPTEPEGMEADSSGEYAASDDS